MSTTTTSALTHAFDSDDTDQPNLTAPAAAFRAGVRANRYPVIPPTVAAALNARDALDTAHRQLYAAAPARDTLGNGLLAALTRGEPITDALDAAVDAHLDLQRRDIAATLIRQAAAGAEDHLRATITDALPDILAGLRAQLEEAAAALRQAYTDAGDLDIDQPDPMLVAQATKTQQAALVTIAEETKRYRSIRTAQRDAITSSSLPVPGDNPWRAGYGWRDFAATGLLEVSAPGAYGLPGKDRAPRLAVRDRVRRPDLWLPNPDQMAAAHDRLEAIRKAEARQSAADDQQQAAATAAATAMGDFDPGSAAALNARTRNRA